MAEDEEKGGRSVRMYDRPADADKPPKNPMIPVLVIVAVLVLALLLARFVFHVHLGHLIGR